MLLVQLPVAIYVHIGHARVKFFDRLQEITKFIELTCVAEVSCSSVSIVYVVCLCIVFSKAALQRGLPWNPMEPPLDPPHVSLPFPPKSLSSRCGLDWLQMRLTKVLETTSHAEML